MMRPIDFLAQLRRFGSLEWYRHGGGAGDDDRFTPPLVVWRFAEPLPVSFAEDLRRIVEDERREIDWLFDTTRRNWVLVPSHVMEEKGRHQFATEAQAADLIVRNEPEYCRRSVRDLDRIIAALDLLTAT
ncbi:hypothetical protein [Nocardia sp. CA-290969]|uniref:hypothetical protein n=1 Tax=Nocardia sp. CA-290969 TaxID=3239986 RepID=UPI003D8C79BC